eukprot:gene8453-biopygen7623
MSGICLVDGEQIKCETAQPPMHRQWATASTMLDGAWPCGYRSSNGAVECNCQNSKCIKCFNSTVVTSVPAQGTLMTASAVTSVPRCCKGILAGPTSLSWLS